MHYLPPKSDSETSIENELKLLRDQLLKGEIDQETYERLRTEYQGGIK